MTTFVDLPTRTSPHPGDVDTDLAALWELFTAADDDVDDATDGAHGVATAARPSLREVVGTLRARLGAWSRRAADWGAVPGTAEEWTTRPVRVPAEVGQ
ncbi:hypothetical protein [Modestobacter roseus]|uniref:Uncharacterized protein n=1 Tax=Modestobacter roseus TaxID=1181884 RepID=A0A562IUA7_9ACTN|nr:hypothetical protein [Modestobacter roseus]MQA33011.1 hypothetical protein [Modestobacter roseus]TWH74532.1 hypothetical protein JD78_03072 [Modestobacter roseus]